MSFAKQFKRSGALALSDAERKSAVILLVEPEGSLRNSLRQMLGRMGYGSVSDAPDHASALKKFEERKFTHVIFEAKRTSMPPNEFLGKVLELDDHTVAIPASWEPNVDDVFSLLILGARGYLVKPFTEDTVEASIVMASKGEPISDAILYAKDRNEALASLILTQVDKLATTLRQSQQFETARRELPRRVAALRRTVDIGRTFARGGPDLLLEAMVDFCLERSNGPATRLGRMRKRLVARKNLATANGSETPPPQENTTEKSSEEIQPEGTQIPSQEVGR